MPKWAISSLTDFVNFLLPEGELQPCWKPLASQVFLIEMDDDKDSTTYNQGKESLEWKENMFTKYDDLIRNWTWELVSLPKGKNIVGCK
jgi:hypothetical protein